MSVSLVKTITVHTDKMGRRVTLVPDEMARMLSTASRKDWHEFVGMADGYSASYSPGHEVHTAVMDIFRLTGDNPGFIVGRSAWDTDTYWWALDVSSPEHRALVPGASPTRTYHDDSVLFHG